MKSDELTTYNIPIFHLIDGISHYNFEIASDFFANFDYNDLKKGNVKLQVTLDKNEHLIVATFAFDGFVELICDRTLEIFDYPIAIENELLLRYGDSEEELADDTIQIMKTTEHINIAHWAYEFIVLGLPLKKLHPRFKDEEDDDSEFRLIYSSDDFVEEDLEEEENKNSPWSILNKLKKKK
jgi:uncharacterized metal-binding protein YceD (DUF177 family)